MLISFSDFQLCVLQDSCVGLGVLNSPETLILHFQKWYMIFRKQHTCKLKIFQKYLARPAKVHPSNFLNFYSIVKVWPTEFLLTDFTLSCKMLSSFPSCVLNCNPSYKLKINAFRMSLSWEKGKKKKKSFQTFIGSSIFPKTSPQQTGHRSLGVCGQSNFTVPWSPTPCAAQGVHREKKSQTAWKCFTGSALEIPHRFHFLFSTTWLWNYLETLMAIGQ